MWSPPGLHTRAFLVFIIRLRFMQCVPFFFIMYFLLMTPPLSLRMIILIYYLIKLMKKKRLNKLVDWFDANKLIINYDKTNVMYFHRSNHDTSNVIIKMKNVPLQVTKSVKFLGIIFDDNLNFNNHRLYICNKMSKNVGVLCKLRQVLPEKHLLMLYNSLILPYIHYCNITWASVGTTILDPIYKLQKKALRICTSSSYVAPSRPYLFFKLNVLNVYDIHKFKIALLMFLVNLKLAPETIANHQYNTRSSSKFHYTAASNNLLLSSFKHCGATHLEQFK